MESFRRDNLYFPVRDVGPVDGRTVIALHGFPQDASCFDDVTHRLAVKGLRTLVPTQRGYAPTNRSSGRRSYRMSELVADVIALADAAELTTFDLVGHDWGGAVAWALSSAHPDRLRTTTILSTPHPSALRDSLVRSDQALKSWYLAAFALPRIPEMLMPRVLARSLQRTGLSADVAERYARGPTERFTGALNWYRALPFSLTPRVGRITVPTTYIWGRNDFALGRVAAERVARYVAADYRFVELGAGHWLPETHGAEVAAAILDRIGD